MITPRFRRMTELRRAITGLLTCFCVCFPGDDFAAGPVMSQESGEPQESGNAELSIARERATHERFFAALHRNPRYGTAFDRVWQYYTDADGTGRLIQRLREMLPQDVRASLQDECSAGEAGAGDTESAESSSGSTEVHDTMELRSREASQVGRTLQLLGMVYARQNSPAEAIFFLEQAEKYLPDSHLPAMYLGNILSEQGAFEESAKALERSLARNPGKGDQAEMLQSLARVYGRTGHSEKSREVLRQIEQLFPDDVTVRMRTAQMLEQEGKYRESLEQYQRLRELADRRKDRRALVQSTLSVIDLRIRLGERSLALEDCGNLLDRLADTGWMTDQVRDRIELIFVRQSDDSGLIRYYQDRLKTHPSDRETVRRLAMVFARLARYTEAEECLRTGLERNPSELSLKRVLIELLELQGRYEEAVTLCSELASVHPVNPDDLILWGEMILRSADAVGSVVPTGTSADTSSIGTSTVPPSSRARRRAEVIPVWNRLLERGDPDDLSTLRLVAGLFAEHGFFTEAESLYRQWIEKTPDDPVAGETLADLFLRQNRKTDALEVLRQMTTGSRRSQDSLLRLSEFCQSHAMKEEAIEALREAIAMDPDDPDPTLRLNLLKLLIDSGQVGEAATLLQEVEPFVSTDEHRNTLLQSEIRILRSVGTLEKSAGEQLNAWTRTAENLQEVPDEVVYQAWKTATCLLAIGEPELAAEVEKVVLERIGPPKEGMRRSPLLLRVVSETVSRLASREEAGELLQLLVDQDPANRTAYLRQIAMIQLEQGETEAALATGRQVLVMGAGNPLSCQYFADILLALGRYDEAAETLRRALRTDPKNLTVLNRLATLYAQIGRVDEAIETEWRIFEHCDRLEEKMAVVGRMANCYQRAGRFSQLPEQLRQRSTGPADRRETACCIARAYTAVSDFPSAERTLETLLHDIGNTGEDAAGDGLLLRQLSSLAELQNHFGDAVRYQEMLCEKSEDPSAKERLLQLYQASGNRERALTLRKMMIPDMRERWRQLEAVDELLANDELTTAAEILDQMDRSTERKDVGGRWELLARRMMIQGWNRSPDVIDTAGMLRETPEVPGYQISEKRRHEKDLPEDQTVHRDLPSGADDISGMSLRATRERNAPGQDPPEDLRNIAEDLVRAIFRDSAMGGHGNTGTRTGRVRGKPIPEFPTRLSAEIAADGWTLLRTFLPPEQENETAADPETLEQLRDRVEAMLPMESTDSRVLKRRYAMELFLRFLADSKYPEFAGWKEEVGELRSSEEVCERITVALARGTVDLTDDSWAPDAFRISLESLQDQISVSESDRPGDDALSGMDSGTIAWMIQTLEHPESSSDPSLWFHAARLSAYLGRIGADQSRNRVDQLIREARERDYAVGLYSGDAEISDEQWAQNLRISMTIAKEKVLDRVAFQRAQTLFRDAFRRRISAKIRELSTDVVFLSPERMKQGEDLWKVLEQKASFGPTTLRLFFTSGMSGSSGPYGEEMESFRCLTPEMIAAADRYEESVLALVDTCTVLEAEWIQAMNPWLLRGASTAQKNTSPVEESRRYLARDAQTRRNLVPFLLGRLAFVPTDGSEMDSGWMPVDLICGSLCVMDEYFRDLRKRLPETAGDFAERLRTDRLTRLENRLAEKVSELPSEMKWSVEKTRGIIAVVTSVTSDAEDEWKDPESLKRRAHKEYQRFRDANSPGRVPALCCLAMIALNESDAAQALGYIEQMPCATIADMRSRELMILSTFPDTTENGERVIYPGIVDHRKRTAVGRLLGYRLSEQELTELLQCLKHGPFTDETAKIRDRLMIVATAPESLEQALNLLYLPAENDSPEDSTATEGSFRKRTLDPECRDQAVVFALKILRSPMDPGRSMSDQAGRIRMMAVDILSQAGRLDEITDQLRTQLESSPGSIDFLMQLADVEFLHGSSERARSLLKQIADLLPDTAPQLLSYARMLHRSGMTEEARIYTKRGFQKQPQLFFRHRDAYQEMIPPALQLELLRDMDPQTVSDHGYDVFSILTEAVESEPLQNDALRIIDQLWNRPDLSAANRSKMHGSAVRLFCMRKNPIFCRYVYQWCLSVLEEPDDRTVPYENIHRLTRWSETDPQMLSRQILTLMEEGDMLESLLADVCRIVSDASSRSRPQTDVRRIAAEVFGISIRLRLGRRDEVDRWLQSHLYLPGLSSSYTDSAKPEETDASAAMVLAMEMERAGNFSPDLIRQCYETAFRYYDHRVYEPFFTIRIHTSGLISEDPRIRGQATVLSEEKFREVLTLAGKHSGTTDRRIGHTFYSVETLTHFVEHLGTALIRAGRQDSVRRAIEETVLPQISGFTDTDATDPEKGPLPSDHSAETLSRDEDESQRSWRLFYTTVHAIHDQTVSAGTTVISPSVMEPSVNSGAGHP
ncbi:MAG: tetratricopeptide repeat protein [Planctomycetia bacterium]|nr:tetratricopeptide repeat protein [Planctomycetia bacterium]